MTYKQWGILVFIAALIGVFYFSGLTDYFTLESIKNNHEQFLAYSHAHYGLTIALFIGLYILQTALALPGGSMMTLLGGALFGSVLGTLYVNIGATIGAILAFLASRYLLKHWVEQRFGNKISAIQTGIENNAFQYLLTLRLVPIFPFFLVNLLLGLTHVRINTYALATSIGIIPASFVYANAGKELGNLQTLSDIVSPSVLASFALLGLLPLMPVLLKKLKKSNS